MEFHRQVHVYSFTQSRNIYLVSEDKEKNKRQSFSWGPHNIEKEIDRNHWLQQRVTALLIKHY